MFDIGWTEMMVIAMLALIIIGPKDLPGALRTVGQWVRKARSLAREFQSGVDEMVREAELDDARKALEATSRGNIAKSIAKAVDPSGELSAEAKAIESSAREATQVEKIGAPAKAAGAAGTAGATGTAGAMGAGEKTRDEIAKGAPGAQPDAPSDTPRATVVKHPAKIAPGNSVKPPQAPPQDGEATRGGEAMAGDTAAEGTAAASEGNASKAG